MLEAELEAVLQTDPHNALARLQLGYGQLCSNDPRAVATLEQLMSASGISRSSLGAASPWCMPWGLGLRSALASGARQVGVQVLLCS